jgi:hypothetical protein
MRTDRAHPCLLQHPGAKRSEVADGMYPEPPDLKEATRRYTAGELFWILKRGAMLRKVSDG